LVVVAADPGQAKPFVEVDLALEIEDLQLERAQRPVG
jgi:hypothetical protein